MSTPVTLIRDFGRTVSEMITDTLQFTLDGFIFTGYFGTAASHLNEATIGSVCFDGKMNLSETRARK